VHTRTTTFRSRRFLWVGALIIPARLAACGSASTKPSSGGTTRQASLAGSAPTSSASNPSAPGSGSSSKTWCPSGAAVSAAMGLTYSAPQESGPNSIGGYNCGYNNSSVDNNVVIAISPGFTAASFARIFQADSIAADGGYPVSGLGNAAYFDPADSTVYVLSRSQEIAVTSTDAGTAAQMEGVARAAIGG
jgi:hypothetical protein